MTNVGRISEKDFESEWSSSAGRETETMSSAASLLHLAGIWQVVINLFAPVGYEDETGFHYGERTKTD